VNRPLDLKKFYGSKNYILIRKDELIKSIKSACDFYLNSKADEFLDREVECFLNVLEDFRKFYYTKLTKNEKEFFDNLINRVRELVKTGEPLDISEEMADYNTWLFKLAFKDIFKGDKK